MNLKWEQKKYPELVLKYKDAEIQDELIKLEDDILEKEIDESVVTQQLISSRRRVQELKKNLRELHSPQEIDNE